jgi:hypothetical protein
MKKFFAYLYYFFKHTWKIIKVLSFLASVFFMFAFFVFIIGESFKNATYMEKIIGVLAPIGFFILIGILTKITELISIQVKKWEIFSQKTLKKRK